MEAAADVGCVDFVRMCADGVQCCMQQLRLPDFGPAICEAVSLRVFLGTMCMLRSKAAPSHGGEKAKKSVPWLSCEAPYSLAFYPFTNMPVDTVRDSRKDKLCY